MAGATTHSAPQATFSAISILLAFRFVLLALFGRKQPSSASRNASLTLYGMETNVSPTAGPTKDGMDGNASPIARQAHSMTVTQEDAYRIVGMTKSGMDTSVCAGTTTSRTAATIDAGQHATVGKDGITTTTDAYPTATTTSNGMATHVNASLGSTEFEEFATTVLPIKHTTPIYSDVSPTSTAHLLTILSMMYASAQWAGSETQTLANVCSSAAKATTEITTTTVSPIPIGAILIRSKSATLANAE